jgi:hypothetical protein
MVAETANGCLVLHIARTIAERHNREPKNLKRLLCALLRSASGELLPSLQTYRKRRFLTVLKQPISAAIGARSSHPSGEYR